MVARISEEEVRQRVSGMSVELVSYSGTATTKSRFRCLIDGHEWMAKATMVMTGRTGCPKCGNRTPVSLDEAQLRLIGRSIEIVAYDGRVTGLSTFKCSKDGCGHMWETTLNSITSTKNDVGEWVGSGCPKCAGIIPLSIEEAHRRLEGRDIRMLEYGGNTTAHAMFECLNTGCGRVWVTSYSNVDFNKRGCPSCYGNEAVTVDEVLHRLEGRQIELLEYAGRAGAHSRLRCMKEGCGYEWQATIRDVCNGGKGCPSCADYGFNPSKPAEFYIYLITNTDAQYIGFGITRRMEGRDAYHRRTFRRAGVSGTLLGHYLMTGYDAQAYEKAVKTTYEIVDTQVEGFRTEAVVYDPEVLVQIIRGAKKRSQLAISTQTP